jgi:succinate semialdehyde reductase (NADPH)
MYSMGGLAEYSVLPASAAFALPDDLTLEDAAILGCASLTAYGAVRHAAEVSLGERVVVVGIGGVGSLVVQFARAQGAAQVVAVDLGELKLQAAASLGATDLVDAATEDPVERVLEVTDGGVDVAFEVLGRPETFLQAVEMLRDGGRMVAVGIAPAGERAGVEITRLVRRGLRIVGSYGGRPRTDMPSLLGLVQRGVLRPQDGISRRFRLDEAPAAYEALDRREIVGRAIVVTGAV